MNAYKVNLKFLTRGLTWWFGTADRKGLTTFTMLFKQLFFCFIILDIAVGLHRKSNVSTVVPSPNSIVAGPSGTEMGDFTPRRHINSVRFNGYKPRRRGRKYWVRKKWERMALWIDEDQVLMLSGLPLDIYVIKEGRVLPYILEPQFDTKLPVIPAQVSSFNFTWRGGRKSRYRYFFDRLVSFDEDIMGAPSLSIPKGGKVPRKQQSFQIGLPCVANVSGVAKFSIGLRIKSFNPWDRVLGSPIGVTLRKRCHPQEEVAPASCPPGYMGPRCSESLCFPHCLHGGVCTSPGVCTCKKGYHGGYCQGGICTNKCQNGGKCIQKDKCQCTRGYYGETCQHSKCKVPCVNGGLCKGFNKCKCPKGYRGNQCQILKRNGKLPARIKRCVDKCRHGDCDNNTGLCVCLENYTGRWCRRKIRQRRPRVWLK